MTKRLTSFVFALVLVFTLIPVTARADSYEIGMRLLNSGEPYTQMTTSQHMVDMIKDMEGFRAEPYWDVSQWSVGYGSGCGTDSSSKPDIVLTEEEAEALLMEDLAKKYGKIVNDYCESIGRQPSQQQFDALVDFTYNLGGSWTDGCWLTNWLEEPTTEMDFVNAMGRWGRVNRVSSYATCMRRIREAIVFLKGEYYLAHGGGDFETELTVVSNSDLPYYKLVIFQGNGGKFDDLSDEIRYYPVGGPYGSFQTPVQEGYELSGWQVTAVNGSDVEPYGITVDALAEDHLELTAVWKPASSDATEPTEPDVTEPEETEPTEPEVTEPEETEPTEPDVTEPEETEPTEPEVTEPEETEPTEPDVTEPEETEPTEPDVTEPEETEPTDPEATEPEETEPTDPEATEPEETDPTEPDVPDVDVDVELPFRDVPENAWYRDAVEFVYQNNYMNGMSDTQFAPKSTVTRGMMVTVLYRIAGSPEVSDADAGYFSDTRGKYYTNPVGWAKANGIVNGISATRFGPNNNITRQDAMTIFYRYCVEYLGLDGTCSGDLSGFVDSGRVSGYARDAISWAVDHGIMNGAAGNGGMMLSPKNQLTRAEAAKLLQSLVLTILETI